MGKKARKLLVRTRGAAFLLDTKESVLRKWASVGGPLEPVRLNGKYGPLRWRVSQIAELIGEEIDDDLLDAVDGLSTPVSDVRRAVSNFDFIGARRWILGVAPDGGLADEHRLSPSERLVLLAMVEHAPIISPSISRLVHTTGISRCQVMRLVASLEARGIVSVDRQSGVRSRYRLHIPPPVQI